MKKIPAALLISVLTVVHFPTASAAPSTNPYGTSTVDPAGPNEVIFTISKAGKKVKFTSAKLNQVKSVEISIYEPFIKKRQSFTVIPISTFFSLVGISGRDKVFTNALNDYIYSNTAAKFISAGAYVAIKRNGSAIPYDQGGPIRLVFADDSKWAKNLDAWNWSLASITAR